MKEREKEMKDCRDRVRVQSEKAELEELKQITWISNQNPFQVSLLSPSSYIVKTTPPSPYT